MNYNIVVLRFQNYFVVKNRQNDNLLNRSFKLLLYARIPLQVIYIKLFIIIYLLQKRYLIL